MELLKQRILKDGHVAPGNVLKVDSFLNHCMDIKLYNEIGKEFARRFAGCPVDKLLTIEASGIGIACVSAQYFNFAPVIFAKKTESKNLDGDIYTSEVESFTKGRIYKIMVSRKFLQQGDRVLVIDDFLANGKALEGLADIIQQAGATLVGAGIVIEKGFQDGGKRLRDAGIRIESLAIIREMSPDKGILFA